MFFYFIFFVALVKANVCPSKEDITPCTCDNGWSSISVTCKNVLNPDELNAPMRVIEKVKAHVKELRIEDSSLMYLPYNIFKNTTISEVIMFTKPQKIFNIKLN